MPLLSKSTPAAPEERAFLQRRVATFGIVSGSLYFFFLGFRTIESVLEGYFALLLGDASYWWHLAGALCLMTVWALCRRGEHSVGYVRVVESTGLLASALAMIAMGTMIPLYARPDYILLMALSCALVARALYVPSSGRRTLLLSLAIGIELIPVVYVVFSQIDIQKWNPVLAPASMTPRQIATGAATNAAAWWFITIVITTGASRVIYGLRRDVRDARQLGQYRLEAKIGEGGMGAVYRAQHAMLRRPTAVKLLLRDKAGEDSFRHFEREVQQTARLSHPNIVTIFDYGHTPDGLFYYAMEYIDGLNLDSLVEADGAMPAGRVVHVLKQVAAALVHAHGEGLIHRDIKPANVMVTLPHRHGGVHEIAKLLDFGLVKELRGGRIDLSHADTVSGTPQYMSPESIRVPDEVDGRSDLYTVGAVAYYLLTGRHVFEGDSIIEVCSHHLHTKPTPPSERVAGLPKELEALILRCLEKEPRARPASALDFAASLDDLAGIDEWSPNDALSWWTTRGPQLRKSSMRLTEGEPTVLTQELRV